MEQRQLFLRDILTVLFKRKLLIGFFTISVVAVVIVVNQVWPPTYESSSRVRILRGREVTQPLPTAVQSPGGMTIVQLGQEDINSEIELILSNDVLGTVVDELDLAGSTGLRAIVDRIQQTLGLKKPAEAEEAAVQDLRESMEVTAVKNSYVLEITVSRGSAEQAALINQALVDAYQKKHLEVFRTQQSGPFFERQMVRIQEELTQAQDDLNAYRNANNIISIDSEKELLEEQYRNAQAMLVQLGDPPALTGEGALSPDEELLITASLSSQTESPVVTELQLKLLELVLRRNSMAGSLGPKHPELLNIFDEIRTAYGRLRDAIGTTRQVTQAKLTEIESRLRELNEVETEMDRLTGKVKVLKDSLEFYANKSEESLVADKMAEDSISSIRIISSPNVPANPVSPNKLLNILIGLVAGVIGGVGLAFFLEYLDHGLKTPEDVEYYLKVPALASFFRSSGKELDKGEAQRLASLVDAATPEGAATLVHVSGVTAGDGGHRVAQALAEAHAEDPAARTLLVDMTAQSGSGFMDVVLGNANLDDALQVEGGLVKLSCGTQRDCPAYVWHGERMESTLKALRDRFSKIVFHTAPVMQSHDGINLAKFSDGSVLVVQADQTRREVVQRAADMIRGASGKVLGVALTERRQVIPAAVYKRI